MSDETRIVLLVEIIILLIIIILSFIYILPIIFIRRFHTVTNILTENVCLAAILCCCFWVTYYIILGFYPTIFIESTIFCSLIPYLQTFFNCMIIYALAMITINRYLTIIYPQKRLFKQKTWSFISSSIQWLLVIILPLPNVILFSQMNACMTYYLTPFWLRFYNLFVIVIFPSIINAFFNTRIFLLVRSSTRRVHTSVSTVAAASSLCHNNSRDVYLLKHMLFIFIVFVSGWTPVYIISMFNQDATTLSTVYLYLQLLPEISSFILILDLFWYNHELREYLTNTLLKYLHLNRN